MSSKIITIIGISLLFFYCLVQILNFYGIDTNTYGVYISFYIFIIISSLILPKSYPSI